MIRIVALAAALAFSSASVLAQQAAAPAAAKPAVKKKATPAKKKAAPAAKALAEADANQLAAAERTHLGNYECDFKQTLAVAKNAKTPGYVDVGFKSKTYTMKPVMSDTGALRLEDVTGRTLLIQIANKSMLMDVKAGQRLVDDCVHENQRASSVAVKAAQQ